MLLRNADDVVDIGPPVTRPPPIARGRSRTCDYDTVSSLQRYRLNARLVQVTTQNEIHPLLSDQLERKVSRASDLSPMRALQQHGRMVKNEDSKRLRLCTLEKRPYKRDLL